VKRLLLLLVLATILLAPRVASAASSSASADTTLGLERKIYVGVGAGFEGGNGIRLGYSIGPYGVETGIGIVYLGETGELQYSFGARYLHTLYEGAYAWIGAGRMGHRVGSEHGSLKSAGAGVGVSWVLGSMFYVMLDSGWRVFTDTEEFNGMVQMNPTFNGALVYKW
jgi:hypothetical protein